jgi:PAS domain S-box-containing protein
VFGYTADDIVGKSIMTLIPPERAAEEDHVLSSIRAGRRVENFDTVRVRKDGTRIDVSVTVSPIRDAGGTIVGASKIARDISFRKAIESRLRDVQHRLMGLAVASASILRSPDVADVLAASIALARDVFDADGYAVWRVDANGTWRIVRSHGISDEFAHRIIPRSAGQPSTSQVPFADPFVCEDVAAVPMVSHMREAYAREGIASMIVFPLVIHAVRSGTMVFYSRRLREYPDVDVQVGTALANLAAASLTTAELYEEQRTAREAADQARRKATFLAEAGSALNASLDYEATLKAVANLAVPAIADWCAVDIAGPDGTLRRLAVAHVDPAKVQLASELEEKYPANPEGRGGVHEVLRTGNATFMARIPQDLLDASARDEEHRRILRELRLTSYMCVPMLSQGKAFGAITFVFSESGREYSEGDLAFAKELAGRAAIAVENARSYARANEASQLKDEFLATLSHELRTPLNSVLGYARMLKSGMMPPEKTTPALEAVERNATALKQIIEDVLDVSRIVAGRLRLNVEAVDLPAILREACATVRPAADARGVRLEMVIDPLSVPVSGDPDRLLQIIWNLLSNAIKFTPRDGKVQIRLSRVNSHVEVAVCDTGRGIAPDFLPFVFERFRQVDATFSREQGGLGLGLAIAKQLAELHGGTITASSDGIGQGATFTLVLPLMIVHSQSARAAGQQPSADRHAPSMESVPRLDGIVVLAIDDEPDSLVLLTTVLKNAGAVVRTASSGPDALADLREHRPDVIVADVGMPGMDGLQLIRQIRLLDEPLRSTPAAALTAYARSQDRIASLASGFQMHREKPIDPLELVVAVSRLAPRRNGSV